MLLFSQKKNVRRELSRCLKIIERYILGLFTILTTCNLVPFDRVATALEIREKSAKMKMG